MERGWVFRGSEGRVWGRQMGVRCGREGGSLLEMAGGGTPW